MVVLEDLARIDELQNIFTPQEYWAERFVEIAFDSFWRGARFTVDNLSISSLLACRLSSSECSDNFAEAKRAALSQQHRLDKVQLDGSGLIFAPSEPLAQDCQRTGAAAGA